VLRLRRGQAIIWRRAIATIDIHRGSTFRSIRAVVIKIDPNARELSQQTISGRQAPKRRSPVACDEPAGISWPEARRYSGSETATRAARPLQPPMQKR
jgi:hypothetical protein